MDDHGVPPTLAGLIADATGDTHGAVAIGDDIHASKGVGNAYLLGTPDGDVVVNTGMPDEGAGHRARFAAVSDRPVRAVVFTQGHPNQIGGWPAFNRPGVDTIVQENHAEVRRYWTLLAPFYGRRSAALWSGDAPTATPPPPEPVPTITFADSYVLEVGGRTIELYSTPGGETTDSLVVWLPDDATVFTGNLFGPIFGHVPNLYTIRGDKLRSAMEYVRTVDRVRALQPEVLVAGRSEPVHGRTEVAAQLTRLRDAVQYLHDETVAGMNSGTDLFTLMREVKLPPELALGEGHGRVAWDVRAIWEEYTGWFRYESTTELYAVPPRAVWAELADLAGGAAVLGARAQAHVDAGEPLEALHLIDVALDADPADPVALSAKIGALELLLERSGGTNFSEVRWLQREIAVARAVLDRAE